MQTLFFFFTSLIASIVVVKLTATTLKTNKHDWLSSVIAVVLSLVVLSAASHLVAGQLSNPFSATLVTIVVSVLLVGFVLESVLDTTFINGMIIATGAIIVQWFIKFGFTELGVSTDMLSLILSVVS